MSTADIAFIAAGAFSGFQQIAHRRAMRDQIGFGRDQAEGGVDPDAIAVDFSADKDILHADVVARMTREFKLEGFELAIDEAVLDHIVENAIERETGARGLASTLTRHIEDVAFGAFGVEKSGIVRVSMKNGAIAVSL
jgi:ATP-dependent protease Clp ATPase subunit